MVAEPLPQSGMVIPEETAPHLEMTRAGLWVVSSFFLLSAANYGFSLVVSHLLGVADYGSFGVVSSVLLLEGLIATSAFPWMLSATVARNPGLHLARTRSSALSTAIIGNLLLGLVSGAIVVLSLQRLVPGHPLVSIFGAVAALAICVNAVWLGLYQGERRFPLLSFLRAGEAILKTMFGLTLMVAGFGLEGAVGGAIAGAVLMAAWGATRVRGIPFPRRGTWWDARVMPSVTWTAAAQLGLALLMNLDILAVRGLGTGAAGNVGAGYYQAATLLARAPVFIGLALLNAVFPFLARRAGDRAAEMRIIRTVLRVTAIVPAPAAVLLLAAPAPAIRFFFPASYGPAVDLLRINAATALSLMVLAAAVIPLQATNRMKRAALAVIPAVVVEGALAVIAVPQIGAEGAAYAALVATSVGAVLAVLLARDHWPLLELMPSRSVFGCLAIFGMGALVIPMPGRTWPLASLGLGSMFLLLLWCSRALSVSELLPLAPPVAREPLQRLLRLEGAYRGRQ